jgi:HD-GYP domain-containing protein (c-di-GMP phosphodiesterase class II)
VANPRTLLPVSVETLFPPATFDFDLYIHPAGPALLYRGRSFPVEPGDMDRLAERGVSTLYIPSASATSYQRYVHEELLKNPQLPPVQRFEILKGATRIVFEETLRGGSLDRMVELTSDLARRVVDVLCGRDLVLCDLVRMMKHDHHTYTHVTNVCAYCLALAERLGIRDRDELAAIGAGALLHDVGKRHISAALLNKPGRLTDPERELIQRHPATAFEELCLRRDLSWGQLMTVYQHHERLNGRGYPVRVPGSEIHPWAKICAVVDVFDALTCHRPYRKPWPTKEALAYLNDRSRTEFDKDMVLCWTTALTRSR